MTLSLVVRAGSLGLALATLSLTAAYAAPPSLVSATPNAKAGWEAFPKQLKLTFNEPIAAKGDEIQLLAPDGRRVRLGAATVSGDGLTVAATPPVSPPVEGPYMVVWQAQSASGEPAKGDFTIFVK